VNAVFYFLCLSIITLPVLWPFWGAALWMVMNLWPLIIFSFAVALVWQLPVLIRR
jgi:hypothetical protein